MSSTTFTVTGMSCNGCEAAVENAVGSVDGVVRVEADFEADTVVVESDENTAGEAVQSAIRDAGYEVVD